MDDQKFKELMSLDIPNTIVTPKNLGEVDDDLVRKLVTELNFRYLMKGGYPKLDELKEHVPELHDLGSEELQELFTKVNEILEEARDCPPYQISFKEMRIADPHFVAACNLIFDVGDKRSLAAKLKDVGLTTRRFNNLLRIKLHRDYYQELIDKTLNVDVWDQGRLALANNVVNGDLPSIKYFAELQGKFVQQREFDPRVITYMMQSVLEVILRNTDSVTARKIADELEEVAVKQLGMGIGE